MKVLRPIRLLTLSVLAIAVLFMTRLLRGDRAPAFDLATTQPVAWPDLNPVPGLADPAEPADLAHEVEPLPDPVVGWAEPVDGACPDGFPIKAKLSSGIFHVPGGASYDRTTPERCYTDVAAAEADGLRQAKR